MNIPVSEPLFLGNEKQYVNECLDSGWISSNGKFIGKFEESFAQFCGSKHAIACCNGTVAIHLALMALDIKAGDEVIVPDLTYVAAANAVSYCGATPVLIDCEPRTWNLDVNLIESKITPKTKAIIVVHLYGHPVDIDPVLELAEKHQLFVVEDAAEAHGALYKNKMVGSLADIATFSFYGNKLITTGEGGMVVTHSTELAEKIRLLRGQGMDPKRRYWFPIIGYNYRMTNIQAAIGLAQLEQIDIHLSKRKEVAHLYSKHLNQLTKYIELPVEEEWASHSYWMFSILLKDTVQLSRDDFAKALSVYGIETRPLFYPMHMLPMYQEPDSSYPVSSDISQRGLNLPTHSSLDEETIAFIANCIHDLCKS